VAFGTEVALGLLALGGLIAFRGNRPVPVWFCLATLTLALLVAGLMARAANLGGQIRHEKIRADRVMQAAERPARWRSCLTRKPRIKCCILPPSWPASI
jgi:hypothetical protein